MPNPTLPTAVTYLSRHAEVRMQQRSITPEAIDLLLDYAVASPVGGGAVSYRFTKATWDIAMSALGDEAPAYRRFRNAYVIEGRDGVIITTAWLH